MILQAPVTDHKIRMLVSRMVPYGHASRVSQNVNCNVNLICLDIRRFFFLWKVIRN